MSRTTKTKTIKAATGLSVYPCVTHGQAREAFAKTIAKNDSGGNSALELFLVVADGILQNGRSFDLQSFQYAARPFEIPSVEVARLFDLWTEKLVQFGKLERIHGAYDSPIFVVCN